MIKYVFSISVGVALGSMLLAASSCVGNKTVVEVADAGQEPVGTMTVEPPTIRSMPPQVNSQITDAVTQAPAPVAPLTDIK